MAGEHYLFFGALDGCGEVHVVGFFELLPGLVVIFRGGWL